MPADQHLLRWRLGDGLVAAALIASLLLVVISTMGLMRNDQTRLEQIRAADEARLAQRLDDVAITSLHLISELRDPEDSLDAVLDDLGDEAELVETSLVDRDFAVVDEQGLRSTAEELSAIAEREQAPPTELAAVLPTIRDLQQGSVALVAASPHATQPVVDAHAAAVAEMIRLSKAMTGMPVEQANPRLAELLAAVPDVAPHLEEPEVFEWNPGDSPGFAEFDQLTEAVVALDESAFLPGNGPTTSRAATTSLLVVSALATGVLGTMAGAGYRRRRNAEMSSVRKLREQARFDSLTGLLNRSELDGLFAAMHRHLRGVGVLYIDLDDFKAANDTHGHSIGDELLRRVAGRITDSLREADHAARIGGDEFLVLMADPIDEHQLRQSAERVVEAISRPVDVDGVTVSIGASVGAALAGEGETLDQAMLRADQAMYRAKSSGGRVASVAGE
ncbi:MAG: GGDEF domain-containing protein [Microthrixaceae bacterium]